LGGGYACGPDSGMLTTSTERIPRGVAMTHLFCFYEPSELGQ